MPTPTGSPDHTLRNFLFLVGVVLVGGLLLDLLTEGSPWKRPESSSLATEAAPTVSPASPTVSPLTTTPPPVPTPDSSITILPTVSPDSLRTSVGEPIGSAPATIYLEELQPTQGYVSTGGPISFNGSEYGHGIYRQFDRCGHEFTVEYGLGEKFDRFQALMGVSDKSSDGVLAELRVFVDGEPRVSRQARRTDVIEVNEAVTGARRLRLEGSSLSSTGPCYQQGWWVWVDARLEP